MKSLRTLALLAAATLLLPGCFVIRGFSFSSWHIPRHGKVVATLNLMPGANGVPKTYVFILIGFPTSSSDPSQVVLASPRRFDTQGNFNGPHKLVKDTVLEDLVRHESNESCVGFAGEFFNVDDHNSHWVLLRTKVPIKTGSKAAKSALTRIGLKPRSPDSSGSLINFYSGFWNDDHAPEGPDVDDTYGCLSSAETNLLVGQPNPTAKASTATKLLKSVRSVFD